MIALLQKYRRFLTFAIIGGVCAIIHAIVVVLLVEYLDVLPTLANLLAFFAANISSYLLNSTLTFNKNISFTDYMRFVPLSTTMLITIILITMAGDFFKVNYIFSLIIAVIIGPIVSYLVLKRFAFRLVVASLVFLPLQDYPQRHLDAVVANDHELPTADVDQSIDLTGDRRP